MNCNDLSYEIRIRKRAPDPEDHRMVRVVDRGGDKGIHEGLGRSSGRAIKKAGSSLP